MEPMTLEIGVDDPRRDDVRALLRTHLAFMRTTTPVEYSFALDVEELVDPAITFFSAREEGRLVGVAALKRLDDEHAELKSMHTIEAERGRGVGRALAEHVLSVAGTRGFRRVSLETGTTEDFASAQALYARMGFTPCDPFGGYRPSPYNTFMSKNL